jgi:hypothetical protein
MGEPPTYAPLVQRVDAVIHAAQAKAAGRWTKKAIRHMHESDALMTRTLAAECVAQGKRFLDTSGGLC